jgi:hypothetical protein
LFAGGCSRFALSHPMATPPHNLFIANYLLSDSDIGVTCMIRVVAPLLYQGHHSRREKTERRRQTEREKTNREREDREREDKQRERRQTEREKTNREFAKSECHVSTT